MGNGTMAPPPTFNTIIKKLKMRLLSERAQLANTYLLIVDFQPSFPLTSFGKYYFCLTNYLCIKTVSSRDILLLRIV